MSINQDPNQIQTTRLETETPTKWVSKTRTRQHHDTQFHGIRKRKWGRYVSEIRLPGKKTRIWLGSFGSPEMAARAYDSAAFFLKGKSASLNFPDLAGSLPRPESCSRRDIQVAAAKAALEPVGNRVESGGEPDFSDWWGLVDGTTSFEEVKEAPLLSPLRLDSVVSGELYSMEMMDNEFLLASCFEL